MKTVKNILTVFTVLLLVACISSPTDRVKYYSLSLDSGEAPTSVSNSLNQQELQVVVGPVQLPKFLRQDKLIMQIGAHEIYSANFHRWAEPLEESVAKVLIQALNKENTHYRFSKIFPQWRKNAQFNLKLEFEKFHATDAAEVVVSGRYWLYDNQSNLKIDQTFNLSDTLTQDGYLHTVEKLQGRLHQLSNEIMRTLNQLTVKQSKQ